jgi:hypothetical protein
MIEVGWQPRALGWFTNDVSIDHLGVVAVSAASQHSPAGSAEVTLDIGLRNLPVESVVSRLCGAQDTYREQTATTSIGYILPEARWLEWLVTAENADKVATELAARVNHYGVPYLDRLARSTEELLAAAESSPTSIGTIGKCRVAVLHALDGRVDDAMTLLREVEAEAGHRTDAAAANDRSMASNCRQWLLSLAHGTKSPYTNTSRRLRS